MEFLSSYGVSEDRQKIILETFDGCMHKARKMGVYAWGTHKTELPHIAVRIRGNYYVLLVKPENYFVKK